MLHTRAASIAADITALSDCALFDSDWYMAQYPEVIANGRDALIHFCEIGWKRSYRPNPLFDPAFYLDQNSDVREAGLNPLRHYMSDGEAEGRQPSGAFNPGWYREHNTDIREAGISPLVHFLNFGANEGRQPCPDPAPSQADSASEPSIGKAAPIPPHDLIVASGLFDPDFYLTSYPDVRRSAEDPLTHFIAFGWREGRRPNAYFDPNWYHDHYLRGTPDSDENPLVHYIVCGERRAFRPIVYFETEWYRRSYRLSDEVSPLLHYLRHRRSQTFSPLSYFDVDFYMRRWGQTVGANRDPFAHFLRVGITDNVDPSPAFGLAQYRAAAMPDPILPSQARPGAEFLEKIRREKFNPLVHFLLHESHHFSFLTTHL